MDLPRATRQRDGRAQHRGLVGDRRRAGDRPVADEGDRQPPLTDAAIDTLVDQAARITSPRSYIIVFQLGGAVARGPDTAFSQRDAAHDVNINAVWLPDDEEGERHVRWVRDCHAALKPHARDRVYVNFLEDEGPNRVRAAYGAATHDRLVALKRRYDPANVLRNNQNISP